ncbi:hypothetical protein Q5Y75_13265 [Ruegeria sp. 2205SS24-7]|uniref:hypothetical protein n=1 Tax=Ruegeria discodermiae TaxID=3064389 RepID=UPI0027423182|nr:hypothetical protein [Ruegeria sp. 2205SS24-7]MDP5218193.1 hypothetical protein [Ruegeria sp. 2205SS24-7]
MRIEAIGLMLGLATLAACVDGASGGDDHTILQDSCEALVAAEANLQPGAVHAISTTDVPGGTLTTVEVAGAVAPWTCAADPTGVILGVEFSQEG